jgi:hypothetical protein
MFLLLQIIFVTIVSDVLYYLLYYSLTVVSDVFSILLFPTIVSDVSYFSVVSY